MSDDWSSSSSSVFIITTDKTQMKLQYGIKIKFVLINICLCTVVV